VAPRPDPLDYISSLSSRRATFSFWPAIESTRSPFPVVIAHHSPEGSLGIPPVVGSRLPSVPVTRYVTSFSQFLGGWRARSPALHTRSGMLHETRARSKSSIFTIEGIQRFSLTRGEAHGRRGRSG